MSRSVSAPITYLSDSGYPGALFAALPEGITLSQVYEDFLAYLVAQTRRYLRDTTGVDLWPSAQDELDIILIHPSQWGTREQQFLKQAVVAAGILSRNEALNHLKFADENEAFTSSCLPMNPEISNKIKVRPIMVHQ